MKKLLIILVLVLNILIPVQVNASSNTINDMKITTTLDSNGNAHIKEIWTIDVSSGTEIYKIMKNMGEKEIKNLTVIDENNVKYTNIGDWDVDASKDEKNYKCGLVNDGDYYELCFGIGEYGSRTYTFEYDVTHFVEQYDGDQGFNFAYFSDLNLDIENVRITIEYPNLQFDENNSSIYAYGYDGYVVFNSGKVVLGNDEILDSSSNKVQILMRIDDGTFSNLTKTNKTFDEILEDANNGSDYEDDNSLVDYIILIAIVFIAIVAVAVVVLSFLMRDKHIYEGEDIKDYDMFRDIPCNKDLFRFYYFANKAELVSDDEKGGLISAVLLKWIKNDYITFNKRKEQGFFRKKDGFAIDLKVEIPTQNRHEEKLLKYFKKAAGSNGLLETNEFKDWCSNNYEKVDKWFEEVENSVQAQLEKENYIRYETRTRKFLCFNIPYTAIIYSPMYGEEIKHVLGFKKFLTEMSLIDEKEVLQVKLWEDYLIFATILSIADKVEKQLGEMYPQFVEESNLDIYYTTVMVRSFSNQSIRAANVAGHGGSSSFSGGGGGFSGGGGGGVR